VADWYQVKVKVISQKGQFEAGHKVGDSSSLKMQHRLVYVRGLSIFFFHLFRRLSPVVLFPGRQIKIKRPSLAPTQPIQWCLNLNECNKQNFLNYFEKIPNPPQPSFKKGKRTNT
jgi:hypothetical protein